MLFTIRSFRNTDVGPICKVWNAHFGDLGFDCRIDPIKLELCTLAKPYFCEQDLLIAEYEEEVVGFLHIGPMATDDLSEVACESASISAFCVLPCDMEGRVAKALLGKTDELLRQRQVPACQVKPLPPDSAFYVGLGPADSIAGLTTAERRTASWITAAGFCPKVPTNQWEMDLSDFQPPMDRQQIQIRRSAHVGRQVEEPLLPWWQACVLGHAEPSAFQLTHRAERRVIAELLYWSVAPELRTVPDNVYWLWPPEVPSDDQGVDQLVFLLGESLRQFQSEQVDVVRTASAATDSRISRIFCRLGFEANQNGIIFEKQYTPAAT